MSTALAHMRISQHQQAEAARLEKERQRIEAEARAKAEREAQAKAQAELEAERQRIRAEEQAQAQAAAQEAAAKVPFETEDGETLTLGQINALLAPVSINAAGLAELGFQPVAPVKAAKLYNESDFPAICCALAQHLIEVATVNA